MSSDQDVEGGVRSVSTAVHLLDCFMNDEELGVTEIARRLGVAKSTAHRLLTTLVAGGLVEQNLQSGKYRLGLHLFELGHLALSRVELRRRSKTMLEELRETSGWMVHLAVAAGADTLYLERLPTLRGMQAMGEYRRRWPLHATSSGKVLCAFDPMAAQARIAAGFPRYSAYTIQSEQQFTQALAQIRRQGFATARNELMLGLSSVAAPVLDHTGYCRAAISITGSTNEFARNEDRQIRLVVTAAKRLGQAAARPAVD